MRLIVRILVHRNDDWIAYMAVDVYRLIDMNHFEAGLIIKISVQSLRPLVLQTQRLKLIMLLTTWLQSSDVQRRLILF